jgi:hypothetical protein
MVRSSSLRLAAACLVALSPHGRAHAALPDAVVALESLSALPAGQVAEAAPPRFVLLEDGRVFVGGTRSAAAGKLEGGELKALESKLSKIRKLVGAGATLTLGPGERRRRLVLRKAAPVIVLGDTAAAPASLRPLAALLDELERFDHPSLRPYQPTHYAVRAREGTLPGGCRSWSLPVSLEQAAGGPSLVPASAAAGWPTGAEPAAICHGEKGYVVTLRPLLPGETP